MSPSKRSLPSPRTLALIALTIALVAAVIVKMDLDHTKKRHEVAYWSYITGCYQSCLNSCSIIDEPELRERCFNVGVDGCEKMADSYIERLKTK
jgi:hypothetical protein